MPNRPPSSTRWTNFRTLAGSLNELLPGLRHSLRHPRRVGAWLEEHHPWLSRRVLSAASNLADPYVAGMGLSVQRLDENGVEVFMPHRWRNQGEGGVVHVGALVTLAEFVSRVYWERNLNLMRHEIQAVQVTSKFHITTELDTRGVMNFSEGEREAVLFRFRSEGEAIVPSQVKVFESTGRLVAEIVVEWRLKGSLALGAGQD
ncbi:MAG: DUF4442 domain-containing protein [Bdellovibrionaceae bacterium]|nr:DUF4442 domain-containing protein [Pseudobdellovibrionaceae bacterium]